MRQQLEDRDGRWTWSSHLCVWVNQEEQLGRETDHVTQGSITENFQTHKRLRWRGPQVPGTYTSPPIQEPGPEGPSLLVGSGGSD